MMATILPSELCIGPAGDWAGSWHRHGTTGALFTNAAAAAAANSSVSLCRVTCRVLVRQYMRGPGKDVFLGVRMVVCVCVTICMYTWSVDIADLLSYCHTQWKNDLARHAPHHTMLLQLNVSISCSRDPSLDVEKNKGKLRNTIQCTVADERAG
eukprot:scpid66232/ scgid11843/ 